VDGHEKISVMTYPPDRAGTPEVETIMIPVIVDTTRDVVVIGLITVVIVAVTTVTQTTVPALLLGIE